MCAPPDGETSSPEWFHSRDAADAYKNEPIFPATMDEGRGYRAPILRSDRTRLEVVPIKSLCELSGPTYGGQNFREYLPLGALDKKLKFSIRKAKNRIVDAIEIGSPQATCELGDDWDFDAIQRDARYAPAYDIAARPIANHANQLILMAHALEEVLWTHHPTLSAEAVAAFWTSWSVWNHFATWSERISVELTQPGVLINTVRLNNTLHRQMWRFAQKVRACIRSPKALEHTTREERAGVRLEWLEEAMSRNETTISILPDLPGAPSRNTISEYIRGTITNQTGTTRGKLAKALHVSVSEVPK